MKIRGIIFDLGKVLIDFSFDSFYDWIEKHSVHNARDRVKHLIKDGIFQNFELGYISSEDFFSILKKEFHLNEPIQTIQRKWNEIFSPIPENLQLLHHFAKNKSWYDIKIVLLSNTNQSHKEYIEQEFKIFSLFDHCIFSYEIHLEKPQREIYEYTLNLIQLKPEEVVFIDDKIENIEGAKQLGIHTIHYTNIQNLEEILKSQFYIQNFSFQTSLFLINK